MNQTDRTPAARRSFLRGVVQTAAAAAGALLLHPAPASAAVAPAPAGQAEPIPLRPEPFHIHVAGGYHEKFRIPDTAEYLALRRRFTDSLSREQLDLYFTLDKIDGARRSNETDQHVEELARHLPQLAPAIRCVAWHVMEAKYSDYGVCCAHPWEPVDEDDDEDAPA